MVQVLWELLNSDTDLGGAMTLSPEVLLKKKKEEKKVPVFKLFNVKLWLLYFQIVKLSLQQWELETYFFLL